MFEKERGSLRLYFGSMRHACCVVTRKSEKRSPQFSDWQSCLKAMGLRHVPTPIRQTRVGSRQATGHSLSLPNAAQGASDAGCLPFVKKRLAMGYRPIPAPFFPPPLSSVDSLSLAGCHSAMGPRRPFQRRLCEEVLFIRVSGGTHVDQVQGNVVWLFWSPPDSAQKQNRRYAVPSAKCFALMRRS